MRLFVFVLCICCLMRLQVAAEGGNLDVHAYLPLLGHNSIARKVLDVTYSLNSEYYYNGDKYTSRKDVHLVFDAETGKYRQETKDCGNLKEGKYWIDVEMWDLKEYVSWSRLVSEEPGNRALGQGIYEHPGNTVIRSFPINGKIPSFVEIFYDADSLVPFERTILGLEPKLENVSESTITIDSLQNKFEIAKKTGALERLTFYEWDEEDRRIVWKMYDFSNHVERSGVWIPLQITKNATLEGKVKTEISVDPKTLRLLDKADNPSIFSEQMPAGCIVDDDIRKKVYMVRTVDRLPNDVEAIQKMLEKMLEQADEQKAAIEEEIKAKKKKK